MTLGVGLLQGPKGGVFLMSEVPLYAQQNTALMFLSHDPSAIQGYLTYKKMQLPRTLP